MNLLVPVLGYQRAERRHRWSAAYRPRLSYSSPPVTTLERPLILHRLHFSLASQLNRRLNLETDFSFQAGDLDYTTINLVLMPQQTTLPSLDVLQWFHGRGGGQFTYRSSRQIMLGVRVEANYNLPLNEESQEGVARSATFDLAPFLSFQETRRNASRVELNLRYAWFPEQGIYGIAEPELVHDYLPMNDAKLELKVGAAFVRVFDSYEFTAMQPGDQEISPIGSIRWTQKLWNQI